MHAIVQDHLEKMLENRLPPDVRKQVEGHLAGCAGCRAAYDEAVEASRWVKLLAVEEPLEPAPGFSVKVMQNIAEVRAAQGWFYFPAWRELGVAAAMFVALLGGYYFTVQATEQPRSAELLLVDAPVPAPAPALVAHRHDPGATMCPECWQKKQGQGPLQMADDHTRREQVIASLVTVEAGD
jgi:hypothetical protein